MLADLVPLLLVTKMPLRDETLKEQEKRKPVVVRVTKPQADMRGKQAALTPAQKIQRIMALVKIICANEEGELVSKTVVMAATGYAVGADDAFQWCLKHGYIRTKGSAHRYRFYRTAKEYHGTYPVK